MIVDVHGRPMGSPDACTHPKTQPAFDPVAAQGLEAHEVRARWPRFFGRCPDCGELVMGYASFEHYAAGDW